MKAKKGKRIELLPGDAAIIFRTNGQREILIDRNAGLNAESTQALACVVMLEDEALAQSVVNKMTEKAKQYEEELRNAH